VGWYKLTRAFPIGRLEVLIGGVCGYENLGLVDAIYYWYTAGRQRRLGKGLFITCV
jgi:hypothetical protein